MIDRDDDLQYEFLALIDSQSDFNDHPQGVLMHLRAPKSVWPPSTEMDPQKLSLRTEGLSAKVFHRALPSAPDEAESPQGYAFRILLRGRCDSVERARLPSLQALHRLGTTKIYVLRDDASERIACRLYPLLYQIENRLRGYLMSFMTHKLGPNWWDATASEKMQDKAKMRRSNERVFSKLADHNAYLIDFNELGEIVYKQSSGFKTANDILARVMSTPPTPEGVRALQDELKSNYDKFFKESFANRDFQRHWKVFEDLRNRIAHGGLFTSEDLVLGTDTANALLAVIHDAEAKAESLVLSSAERESVVSHIGSTPVDDSEVQPDDVLEVLDELEDAARRRPRGFAGYRRLVWTECPKRGYSTYAAKSVLDDLERSRQIEFYYVDNPDQPSFPTRAVRRRPQP